MKKIEFFGLPNSGKSFFFTKIRKTFRETHNYESIFYFWLFRNKKISYLSYKLISNFILNEINDHKKNKFLFFLQRKIYFFIKQKSLPEFNIQQNKIKKKYKLFFVRLDKLLDGHKDTNRLSKMFASLLLGYELAKTMRVDLISSEGLAQRIFGILLRKKISKRNIRAIINCLPKPSHIVYFFKDKRNNFNIEEIVKAYYSLKVKFILIEDGDQIQRKLVYELKKVFK